MIKKVRPPRSWWIELGTNAKAHYRNFIFDGGKNVYGSRWFGGRYSPEYGEQKRNNEFSRQDETLGVKITAVLTGGVLQAFDAFLKPVPDGIQFGYNSKGDIVKKLRKQRGKEGTLTSKDKPVPDATSKFLAKEYHEFIRKNQKNKTRYHRGRKK